MPVTARHPYTPHIVATLANPGGGVAAEYDPLRFTLGETLYARNETPLPRAHLLTLGSTGTRFWFPIAGGTSTVVGGDLAPLYFAGGIKGAVGAVTGFLGDDPVSDATTTALQFPKTFSMAGTFEIRRALVFLRTDTMASTVTLTVMLDGAPTAITLAIPAASAAGNLVTNEPGGVTITDGQRVDVRLQAAAGSGGGNEIVLSAAVEFIRVS